VQNIRSGAEKRHIRTTSPDDADTMRFPVALRNAVDSGRRATALALLAAAGRAARGRPLPVWTLTIIRRAIPLEDALVPERSKFVGTAVASLRNPVLARRLGSLELGGWTLPPATINFIEQTVQERRPDVVLEFGSGISTVCLAQFMRELHGNPKRLLVMSVDEHDEYARETRARLAAHEVADNAVVVVAPVRDQAADGTPARCYLLPPMPELRAMLDNRRADLVVVDGPTLGSGGSRFATVIVARDLIAEGATILVDDARRDAELTVARQWQRLPGIAVRGVHLVGKGILEARMTASANSR
jgi:Methyltransferase domain